jgi:hypothetical protein
MPVIVLWRTVSTDQPGERFSIESSEVVVGRSMACGYRIPLDLVSRRHLRIWLEGARTWKIEDLGSSNGTFVNGERVKLAEIRPGDVIRLGPAGPCLRVLSLDPPPEGAKAITEEIALHWMKRVTENISAPSDSQGMSSIEFGTVPEGAASSSHPLARPAAPATPPAPGRPPHRQVPPEKQTPAVPDEGAVSPPAGAPTAPPPRHPSARRRPILRVVLVILLGAALGTVVGLQLLSGLLGAERVNAPALFIGIHLVKLGTGIPTGMILPALMAAYVAGLFASAQFPGRGWLLLVILLLIHWGTAVLIRTDPDTVKGLLEATVLKRDEVLRALTGR